MSMVTDPTGYDLYLEFQYRITGSFYTSLFETIHKADRPNQARLAKAFPEEVDAVRIWTTQGWEALLEKVNDKHPFKERMRKEYEPES